MPYHNEECTEIVAQQVSMLPVPFRKAVVVISNLVARATTRWTLEESKLFIIAVSQIEKRDEQNWVKLNKGEVMQIMGLHPKDISKLREKAQNVRMKSNVKFNGPGAEQWQDGFLITDSKADNDFIYLGFNEKYIPLLHYVKDTLFTSFELINVIGFEHFSSYNLYLHLSSWHNVKNYLNVRGIAKFDLPKVFNLKEGQYWRNYGEENAKFDWASFERFCLRPAIEEINASQTCDMYIEDWQKMKDPNNLKTVIGYEFKWSYRKPDGDLKTAPGYYGPKHPEDVFIPEDVYRMKAFVQRFRKVKLPVLEELSEALSYTEWNDQPAFSVNELQEEQKQDFISSRLFQIIDRRIKMDFVNPAYLCTLFGYAEDEEPLFSSSLSLYREFYRLQNESFQKMKDTVL